MRGGGSLDDMPNCTINHEVVVADVLDALACLDYTSALILGHLDVVGLCHLLQLQGDANTS